MTTTSKRDNAGFSLTELVMAVTILSLVVLTIAPFFNMSQKGYSSMEARNSLKTGCQHTINRIGNKLAQNKKFLEDAAAFDAFRQRMVLTTPPAPLAGTRLATIEPTGSLSPGTTFFAAGAVGNALAFASIEAPMDFEVRDSSDAAQALRIDSYVFNYYFLAENSSELIGGQTRIDLWEWHSVRFADYIQLATITDAVKRQNAVIVLYSSGTLYAWDPSITDVTQCFYEFNASGQMTLNPNLAIAESEAKPMIKLLKGMTMGGYRYGVSPNTGLTFTTNHPVPSFAPASARFPSGFEIAVIGPNSARQIITRLVLVAQGTFPGNIAEEQILLTTARDLW